MKFIFARHGETEANRGRIYSGWSNYELTDEGKEQIKWLAAELKKYEAIDKIYVSPLKRTKETAQGIADAIGRKMIEVEALKELNFGLFDGKTKDEIEGQYHKEWNQWLDDYINYPPPMGESVKDLVKRVQPFIDDLKEKEGCCVIVTHGGVIQAMITHLLELDLDKMWHFRCAPGGYAVIEYRGSFGVLQKLASPYQ